MSPPDDEQGLKRAAFLDRDGTVIEDRHYLGDPAGVVPLPGAARAIARLNDRGIPVVIVTNQSGIGRGLFAEADFDAVQRRMAELLAAEGARIDASYHCPHAPDLQPPCDCRKPAPALYDRAARDLGIDLSRSWFVGDRERDLEAGIARGGIGYLLRHDVVDADAATTHLPRVRVVHDLAAAVDDLLANLASD